MLVCSNPGVGVNCGRFVFKLHLVPPNLESEGVYHICCTKLQPGPTAAVEIFPLFTLNRRNVWKLKRVHAPRSQVHPGFKLVNLLSCDSFPDLLVDNWSLGWVAAILPIWSPSSFFALTFLTCVLQVLVAGEFWVGGSSLLPDPETNNVWEAASTRETFSSVLLSASVPVLSLCLHCCSELHFLSRWRRHGELQPTFWRLLELIWVQLGFSSIYCSIILLFSTSLCSHFFFFFIQLLFLYLPSFFHLICLSLFLCLALLLRLHVYHIHVFFHHSLCSSFFTQFPSFFQLPPPASSSLSLHFHQCCLLLSLFLLFPHI